MVVIRFNAPVELIGNRAIVKLPDEASAMLPTRGQVATTGTVDGQQFATVVEPDGRRGHWFDVGSHRADSVSVELEVTSDWPEPHVAEDLREALQSVTPASETWANITPRARWEWVRWVNATRNPETRERRIMVSVDKLRKGMRRPCCFDLSSCTDPELSRSGKLIEV